MPRRALSVEGWRSATLSGRSKLHEGIQILRGRRRIFYGWWMLAASVAATAVGSGVSMWVLQLYVRPMEDAFSWSRAEVTLGFSISLLLSGLAAPLIGRWIDRRGPREVLMIGAVLTAATYVLLATTTALWQWYFYLTINATFRQMMFFLPFQALISRWFNRKRGLAIGILGSGFGIGGLIILPVMRVVIDEMKWDGSFLFSAGVILAVFIPIGALVLRDDPSDVGAEVDGEPPSPGLVGRAPAMVGITLRQALRMPLFWAISTAFVLFFFGLFGWLIHGVPFYETQGISPGMAAALVSLTAGLGIVTRPLFGSFADRLKTVEYGAVTLVMFMAAAFLMLIIDTGVVGITLFILFWIVGSSGGPLLQPILLSRTFGVAYFATILGAMTMIITVGQVTSPVIIGAIFDATGSYDWGLVLLIGALCGAVLLFWVAACLPHPDLSALAAAPPAAEPASAASTSARRSRVRTWPRRWPFRAGPRVD